MSNPWAIHGMIRNGHCQSPEQRGYLIQKLKEEGVYGGGRSSTPYAPVPSSNFSPDPMPRPPRIKPVPQGPVTETEAYKHLEERLQKLTSKAAKRVIENQMRAMRRRAGME